MDSVELKTNKPKQIDELFITQQNQTFSADDSHQSCDYEENKDILEIPMKNIISLDNKENETINDPIIGKMQSHENRFEEEKKENTNVYDKAISVNPNPNSNSLVVHNDSKNKSKNSISIPFSPHLLSNKKMKIMIDEKKENPLNSLINKENRSSPMLKNLNLQQNLKIELNMENVNDESVGKGLIHNNDHFVIDK